MTVDKGTNCKVENVPMSWWSILTPLFHLFKNPEKTWTEWLPSLEKLVVHHHPLEERLKDLICFLLIGYQLIIINTWLLYVPLFHLLKILVQESPPVARRVATVDRTPCSARGDSLLSMIFDWENLKKSGCHCQPFSLIKWRWRTKMTIMRYATK